MRRTVLVHFGVVLVICLASSAWAEAVEVKVEAAPESAAIDAAVGARVKRLISEGGYYYSIGRFEQAIELAETALKLAPKSVAARQLKIISVEAVHDRDRKNWVREQRKDFQAALRQVNRDKVGQRELLRHGPNWSTVKKRTGGVYGPAAKINENNRPINAMLDSVRINADFAAKPLCEVVRHLANLSKLNIQVDPRATSGEKRATETEVTFQARDMKLRNVLTWIARFTDLTWIVRDEVVLITDKEHLDEFKVTGVYDISDIIAPIPDYQSVPEFDMTLPAINARRIGYGFYEVPTYWDMHGVGPFTGAYFVDFAARNRYFMTEDEVRRLVEALIEGEEGK